MSFMTADDETSFSLTILASMANCEALYSNLFLIKYSKMAELSSSLYFVVKPTILTLLSYSSNLNYIFN